MNVGDTLFYADWRIRKVVAIKNRIIMATSEVMFKDYYYKKSRLILILQAKISDRMDKSCISLQTTSTSYRTMDT